MLDLHRCNNVLYIRGVEEEEEDGEMREWCRADVCLCFHRVKQMNVWGYFSSSFESFFFLLYVRPVLCRDTDTIKWLLYPFLKNTCVCVSSDFFFYYFFGGGCTVSPTPPLCTLNSAVSLLGKYLPVSWVGFNTLSPKVWLQMSQNVQTLQTAG